MCIRDRFYSNSPSPSVCTYEGDDPLSTPPRCVDSSPLALEKQYFNIWTIAAPVLAAVMLCSFAVGCFTAYRKPRESAAEGGEGGAAAHARKVPLTVVSTSYCATS